MIGIHIGLDLEDEACDLVLRGVDGSLLGLAGQWPGGPRFKRVKQRLHAEIAQRASEENGCQVPFVEGPQVEFWQRAACELQSFHRPSSDVLIDLGVSGRIPDSIKLKSPAEDLPTFR